MSVKILQKLYIKGSANSYLSVIQPIQNQKQYCVQYPLKLAGISMDLKKNGVTKAYGNTLIV